MVRLFGDLELIESTFGFNRRKMVVFIKEMLIKVRKAKGANLLAVKAGSFLAKENLGYTTTLAHCTFRRIINY